MLQDAQSAISNLATSDPPSVDLNSVLSVSVEIASDIATEAKKGTKISNTFPAADSTTVKDWQSRFQTQYAKAQKLAAVAKSLPGGAAAGIPLMANSPDPAVQIAQTNAKCAQAQATLEAAKNRLATTQDTFLKTQEIYAKNTALLLEQENKLTEVQAELSRLNQSKLGLTEIKSILQECIKLIINVKQQIMNLCSFFKAISAFTEAVVKYYVQPFLDEIATDVSADGSGAGKVLRIGHYTFTDLQRSMLYSAVVTVRSHFSVFSSIAGMWARLSTEQVMPGIRIMDDISNAEPDLAKRQMKVAQLQTWANGAIDAVKKVAHDKQSQILEGMAARVDDVQTVTKRLPATLATQKAIEAGTNEVKKAAEDAIVANAASNPLNRFAPKHVSD